MPLKKPPLRGGAAWIATVLWVARRVAWGFLTLIAVSLIVFMATHLLPGDAARVILGPKASPAQVAELRQLLGLDRPAWEQYTNWIGGLFHGELGTSVAAQKPVTDVVGAPLGVSLQLLLACVVVAIPVSVGLGVAAAIRPGGLVDHVINAASVVFAALPEFITGLILVMVFAVGAMHVLPAVSLIRPGEPPLADPRILVLPTLTLTLAVTPYLSRLVRASLIEALQSDYAVMARLKGLPTRTILIRHALRNSLVPAVQGTALALAYMLGGVVIVEYVFQYPGLGAALQESVNERDVPVLQAIVMFFACAFVLFNLAADILTVALTPRLRAR